MTYSELASYIMTNQLYVAPLLASQRLSQSWRDQEYIPSQGDQGYMPSQEIKGICLVKKIKSIYIVKEIKGICLVKGQTKSYTQNKFLAKH